MRSRSYTERGEKMVNSRKRSLRALLALLFASLLSLATVACDDGNDIGDELEDVGDEIEDAVD
jgi:hypothetical protein